MVEIISIVDTYFYSEQLRVDTGKISIKYNEAIILVFFCSTTRGKQFGALSDRLSRFHLLSRVRKNVR